MNSLNKVLLLGNLGQQPEIKKTTSGMSVCTLSIATNDRRKDDAGSWQNIVEWHNVVTFGSTAENCAKYLNKGSSVLVEGKIQTRKWQDKEGNNRYTTEIIANNVQFIGAKGSSASIIREDMDGFESSNYDYKDSSPKLGLTDDDIPF